MTDPDESTLGGRGSSGDPRRASSSTVSEAAAHRRLVLVSSSVAVVFLLLATAAVFAGVTVGSARATAPPAVSAPGPAPVIAPPSRAVPRDIPTASSIRTCSISRAVANPALKKLFGSVIDGTTGEVLYDRHGAEPAPAGSALTVLTAASALAVLGPDYRLTTRVLDSSTPGSVTLVGGGDFTLTKRPGRPTVYAKAPTMVDLAEQTKAAYEAAHPGVPLTHVVLDASYWNPADNWASTWNRREQTRGNASEVTALQIDGDRADAAQQSSPRSTDPVGRAGNAFVGALGIAGVTTSIGTAEADGTELAAVRSQPVQALVRNMLLTDDNTTAEMLARVVSKRENLDGSFESLHKAIPMALSKYGVDTSALTIADGSGLSDTDAVPASFMAAFLVKVGAGSSGLQYVYTGLPISGKTGNLANRFSGDNAVASGKIHAKAGETDTVSSLAGYTVAVDGTPLGFTFAGVGTGITSTARQALDTLATRAYVCGTNLTPN